MDLFAEVEEVKRTLTGKNLSLVLKKKEAGEDYWPRLTKEKVKLNFVKVRPLVSLPCSSARGFANDGELTIAFLPPSVRADRLWQVEGPGRAGG